MTEAQLHGAVGVAALVLTVLTAVRGDWGLFLPSVLVACYGLGVWLDYRFR